MEGGVMGDFRVVVEGVGGHGCGREAGDGEFIPRCDQPSCPDCLAREFVGKLRTTNNVTKAVIEHWPVPGAANTTRTENPGPIDDLLTGKRRGSFNVSYGELYIKERTQGDEAVRAEGHHAERQWWLERLSALKASGYVDEVATIAAALRLVVDVAHDEQEPATREEWIAHQDAMEAEYERGRAEGAARERERCAVVVDALHAEWEKNCNRPQSEHSGPSYAAAVAGAAATRDAAAAIRALTTTPEEPKP